jgi:hypothetical protein
MNNTETLKIFKRQFKRWTYMVAHYGWKLTTYYYDSAEDMPKEAGADCIGLTVSNFKYLEGCIYINLKKANDLTESEIEYVVIHELTHLLVSPLAESADITPLEYTVTSLARIMQGLRND